MSNDYLAVCGVYRDESEWLREWLEYYIGNGVDRFFLYCDDPDPLESLYVLQPYLDRGLIDWTHIHSTVGLGAHERSCAQNAVYEDCCRRSAGRFRWLAIADLDEFYLPLEHGTLRECLRDFEEYKQILVSWHTFGTNGFEDQPPDQINHLFRRAYVDERSYVEHKAIVDPETVAPGTSVESATMTRIGSVHSFTLKEKYQHLSVMPNRSSVPAGGAEPVPTRYVGKTLVVNHYRFRARKWYLNTKVARGRFTGADTSMDKRWLRELLKNADVNIVYDDFISKKFGHLVKDIDNSDILQKTMPLKRFIEERSSFHRKGELRNQMTDSERRTLPPLPELTTLRRRVVYHGLTHPAQGGLMDCFKSFVGLSNALYGYSDVRCVISKNSVVGQFLKNGDMGTPPAEFDIDCDWNATQSVPGTGWSAHIVHIIQNLFQRKDELHVICPFLEVFQKPILAPDTASHWSPGTDAMRKMAFQFFEAKDEFKQEIDAFVARMSQGRDFRIVHCRMGDQWMRPNQPSIDLEKAFAKDHLSKEFLDQIVSLLGTDAVLISDCQPLKELVRRSGTPVLGISDVQPSHSTSGAGDGLGILKDLDLLMRAKRVDTVTNYATGFSHFLAHSLGIPSQIHRVGQIRAQVHGKHTSKAASCKR